MHLGRLKTNHEAKVALGQLFRFFSDLKACQVRNRHVQPNGQKHEVVFITELVNVIANIYIYKQMKIHCITGPLTSIAVIALKKLKTSSLACLHHLLSKC